MHIFDQFFGAATGRIGEAIDDAAMDGRSRVFGVDVTANEVNDDIRVGIGLSKV